MLFFDVTYSPRRPKGWTEVLKLHLAPVVGAHVTVPSPSGITVRCRVLEVTPRAYGVDDNRSADSFAADLELEVPERYL